MEYFLFRHDKHAWYEDFLLRFLQTVEYRII